MEVVQTIHVVHFDTVDGSSDCIPAAKFQMQLSEMAKVQVAALSGGWRRRVSSSVAFLGDPTIVFLDEPTAGKAHAAFCSFLCSLDHLYKLTLIQTLGLHTARVVYLSTSSEEK